MCRCFLIFAKYYQIHNMYYIPYYIQYYHTVLGCLSRVESKEHLIKLNPVNAPVCVCVPLLVVPLLVCILENLPTGEEFLQFPPRPGCHSHPQTHTPSYTHTRTHKLFKHHF